MSTPDWHLLRAFHATASHGSLSGAARALGLTQPTLSRQIAELEAQLGTVLFTRSGRRLILGPAGAALLPHVTAMEEAARDLTLAAAGQALDISGEVTLSLTDIYAVHVLPSLLGRLREEAPQVTLRLIVSDSPADLHRREADIALRHGPRPQRPGLAARHLRDSAARIYASEGWIARNGLPQDATALASAGLIAPDEPEGFAQTLARAGILLRPDSIRLISTSGVAMWEMARQGLGPAIMLDEIGDETPGMVRLLPDLAPIRVPLWLITHADSRTSRRIRFVEEFLTETIGGLAQPPAPPPPCPDAPMP